MKLKSKVKEQIMFILSTVIIVVFGIMIVDLLAWRFHSIENDSRFYEQKKTDSLGTQISQNEFN